MSSISLGKTSAYPQNYNPKLLEPIPRRNYQSVIPHFKQQAFGIDHWRAYEFSCLLNSKTPISAILDITYPCHSEFIVESKSLKYYLNSFFNETFSSLDSAIKTIQTDLENCLNCPVLISEYNNNSVKNETHYTNLDILKINKELDMKEIVSTPNKHVNQCFQTHHFRSLCPVTGQPDWASIFINYEGKEIEPISLYNYLISFRQHQGFHEQCVEWIFSHLLHFLSPKSLTVRAQFTRRGGIEINPIRSTHNVEMPFYRTQRQ